MSNGPIEPSADMRSMASHFRQMFLALTQEGFSEEQGLHIVSQIIRAGFGSGAS